MINCTFEDGNTANLRHVVVDGLVIVGNKILLIKRAAHLSEAGKWALVGGFLELDETTTEGFSREVYEETGWEVADITLLRVNDGVRKGENRQNVSFVYVCTATKKTGEPDNESTEQRWFPLDKLPSIDQIAFDHAENIALYKQTIGGANE